MVSKFWNGLRKELIWVGFILIGITSSHVLGGVNVQIPTGITALGPVLDGTSTRDIPDEILNNPDVAGVSIRIPWSLVEPQEGTFKWDVLERQMARVRSASKFVILRVMSGSVSLPEWLLQKVQTIQVLDDNPYHTTYGQMIKVQVFWDPELLKAKGALYVEMGQRYGNDPHVEVVDAAFANAHSDDWSIPSTPEDLNTWLAAGYTPDKLIEAGKKTIDMAMAAFPNKAILTAVATDKLDTDPLNVPRQVIAFANATYPGRLIVQNNRFSAITPSADQAKGEWQLLVENEPLVAGQMLWYVSGDLTYRMNGGTPGDKVQILTAAFANGASYGTLWMETYYQDLLDPEFQSLFHTISQRMRSTVKPLNVSRISNTNLHGIIFDDHGTVSASTYGNHPLLSGIFLRADWSALNSSSGAFDFTSLESQITAWAPYGKTIYIGIKPIGQQALNSTPEWVYNQGVQKIYYLHNGSQVGVPKVWNENTGGIDANYLSCYSAMVHALAEKYRNDPRIAAVMVGIGELGYMTAISDGNARNAFYTNHWTAESYEGVMRSIVALYKQEFPNKELVVHPTSMLLRDPQPPAPHTPFYRDVISQMATEFAQEDGVTIFGNGLDQDEATYIATDLPTLFGNLSSLALNGNHQQGVGDDWPLFGSAGPSPRTATDFDNMMKYAIGGVDSIPPSKISFIKFLEPELQACFPGHPNFNQAVYDSTRWMLDRLVVYPPMVILTSPVDGTSYTDPATINITADASDSNGRVTEVDFYDGDTLLGIVTTTPYTYTLNSVGAGTYSFTAKAKDNNGVVATSGVVNITVNPAGASFSPSGSPSEGLGTQTDQVSSTGNTQDLTSTPTVGMVGTAQGGFYANVPAHSEDSVALGNAYSPLKMAVDDSSKFPSPSSSDHPSSPAVSPSVGIVSSGTPRSFTRPPYISQPSQSERSSSPENDGLASSPVPSSALSVSSHQPQVFKDKVEDKEDTSTHLPLAVSIISPKSGAIYPAGTPISFAVEVTTGANVVKVRFVRFYDGPKLLGALTKPSFTLILNGMKPGPHSLEVKVTGTDGVTTSKVVQVTVKSTWSSFFKNFFSAIKGFFTSLF